MPRQDVNTNWCFTINNWTAEDKEKIAGWVPEPVKYVAYGEEHGEEKGTPHLQGWLKLQKRKGLVFMKELHATAHWSIMRGRFDQNEGYCSKEGHYTEHGEKPVGQGHRSDLERACERLKTSRKIDDVYREFPTVAVKYHKGLARVHAAFHEAKRDWVRPELVWIYGPSGNGKTRLAHRNLVQAGQPYFEKNPETGQWWDGYSGESTILLDDFRGDHYPPNTMLRWWGGYSFDVQIKGGVIRAHPERWVITSDRSPQETWLQFSPETVQILRRIDEFCEVIQLADPFNFDD